jgi:hypothetical protein
VPGAGFSVRFWFRVQGSVPRQALEFVPRFMVNRSRNSRGCPSMLNGEP